MAFLGFHPSVRSVFFRPNRDRESSLNWVQELGRRLVLEPVVVVVVLVVACAATTSDNNVLAAYDVIASDNGFKMCFEASGGAASGNSVAYISDQNGIQQIQEDTNCASNQGYVDAA